MNPLHWFRDHVFGRVNGDGSATSMRDLHVQSTLERVNRAVETTESLARMRRLQDEVDVQRHERGQPG